MKHVLCSNGSWIDESSAVLKETATSAYVGLFMVPGHFIAGQFVADLRDHISSPKNPSFRLTAVCCSGS